MAESSNLRKSTRKRQSNKRYSIDPFEALNITSSGSEHDVETLEELGNQDEDEDFISDQEAEAADEDNVSLDELSDGLESGLSVARNKSLSRADDDPDLFRWTKPSSGSKSARWKQRKEASKYVHSRGLKELPTKSQAKDEALKLMLGSNHQDWVPFLRSRDQWINEPTLPRRTNNTDGVGGMCHHFSHTEEKRNMEATVGWDWYYSQGGKILFAKQQSCQVLNSDEAFGYLPKPTESSYRVLMGPYGRQRLFSLSFMQSLYLNEAWISPLNPSSDDAENQKPKREGWMLNAGTSITCLDWVPNQDGEVQYLAIATAQTKEILNQEYSKSSPAYTPLPSLSCIQIWAFTARETPDHQSLLDSKKPPQLQLVICTEWGNIKQLKWCQIPRTHRAEDSSKVISLGLLAAIWGDGYVRILDIELEKELEHKTSWIKYDQPAFQARPPNTLCTCITWLSATDIAVGSAHGFLAIWDINPLNASLPQNTTDATTSLLAPTPWLYLPLHGSYILGVTSAYPTYPHLLITSSIDGYTRLTDLRSPQTDTVVSLRSRIASPLLCFSPALVSLISTEDNDSARAYPLRCFYTSVGFARGGALPLCLSTGHFHPMVLVGCADGALIASNPMRKVLYRKAVQHQQTVFRHEWTRHAGRGVSRITEGYKAESMAFQRATKGSKRKKGGGGGGGGGGGDGDGTISTIHEAETAVTQVVWNSNLSCGGWIAAGMGNGLVRVQDLAI